ncbi:MAG: pseudouridine-5'-phosphate glycosidase [Gemmatimonadota bacterium]|nr:pseudouridine-5'-phosphate glycosidase [Gemmatimonadota bacterium]
MTNSFELSAEVEAALTARQPVVALETTVIAHGLPYPRNVEVAAELEGAVREEGAVPATIGVVGGDVLVGMDEPAIDRFGADADVLKASARDLGAIIARGDAAATTVAATSLIAARAGIDVVATGGIGGVHPGGEGSLDISADLNALASTPVTVVCAGAKAILDLPRTLEVLETLGVPLLGLGTDEFPAFYTRTSGLRLEHVVEDEDAAARAILAHRSLDLRSAVVVCNPPPAAAEMDRVVVSELIDRALSEAADEGVSGKALTPWLLARLAEMSDGDTVRTNVALLESNVRVAARIARALREGDSPKVRGF